MSNPPQPLTMEQIQIWLIILMVIIGFWALGKVPHAIWTFLFWCLAVAFLIGAGAFLVGFNYVIPFLVSNGVLLP